jgi:hypothetical protein
MIAGASAGDVKQMALGVVNVLKVTVCCPVQFNRMR